MLLKRHQLDGIRENKIQCVFRCWRRPTVKAGGQLRTAMGVLAIDAVEVVQREQLTLEDAERAGHTSLEELLAELGVRAGTLYRVDLHLHGADPRIALRQKDKLSADELDELRQRLDRLDARSRSGPWTQRVLELVRDHSGKRAADLARELGRETPAFKRDVRKLKELGLTESLEVGYRLSPRGARVLRALHGA